jgi:excisionase family DNA binding protein
MSRAEGPLLRVRDIAGELGCTPAHVYRLVSRGVIPSVRVANAIRIPAGAWRQWLESQDREALRAVNAQPSRATNGDG